MNRAFASILLIALAALSGVMSSWNSADGSPAADEPATRKSLDALKAFIADHPLELSTESTSSADRFCLEFTINPAPEARDQAGTPRKFLIIRDLDRVAILAQLPSGECYSYCSNGVLLTPDQQHPGALLEMHGGTLVAFFGQSDDGNSLSGNVHVSTQAEVPSVMFSMNSVLAGLTTHIKSIAFDEATKCFKVATEHDSFKICLAAEGVSFPLKSFSMMGGGVSMDIAILKAGPIPEKLKPLLNHAAIKKRLTALRIEIRDFDIDDGTSCDTLNACLYGPPDLEKNAAERDLIGKLTKLLTPECFGLPSSRP
jgi:hypothetical protein